MPAGRPSDYTDALTDIICERIANGESLKAICDDDKMPSQTSVFKWLGLHQSFAEKYARAREAQADALFDEILSIADDGRNDWMERKDKEDENLGWRENGEAMRRSQLRIDARKWMASKLKPKKYGDKLDVDVAGHVSLTFSSDDEKL
jgi:hypothetical protein